MKKSVEVVFSLLVVAFLFAGCAAPTAAPTPAATAAATAAPTVAPTAAPEAVCASDPFGCAMFKPGENVKIGMGAPMTGGNSSFGIDISQGATIAIKDGGNVDGWAFELDAQDDGGTAEGGAAVANKFASDPAIVAVAGHIFSGATAAAVPIYEKVGIPMLSPSATNPALTTTGSKVFNRIAFTDNLQGKFAAEFLFKNLGIKNLAVVHDGTDYGKGLAEIVAAHFKELGGTVVDEEAITPGETDYTAVLSTVAAKTPDAIYFGGYIAEASVLVNELKQTGLGSVKFFGDDGTYGQKFIDNTGKNGEGAYATVAPASPDSAAKDAFNTAYTDAFGTAPGTLSPFTWAGYDSAAALIFAVKQVAFVGSDGNLYVPRTALVNAVRNLKDYVGLSGTFTCNEVGECNTASPSFVVVKDGAWVPAE
jgi:branched-chain amino acid transport system substrate-binding protein